jgi:hypothetical protein
MATAKDEIMARSGWEDNIVAVGLERESSNPKYVRHTQTRIMWNTSNRVCHSFSAGDCAARLCVGVCRGFGSNERYVLQRSCGSDAVGSHRTLERPVWGDHTRSCCIKEQLRQSCLHGSLLFLPVGKFNFDPPPPPPSAPRPISPRAHTHACTSAIITALCPQSRSHCTCNAILAVMHEQQARASNQVLCADICCTASVPHEAVSFLWGVLFSPTGSHCFEFLCRARATDKLCRPEFWSLSKCMQQFGKGSPECLSSWTAFDTCTEDF